VKNVPVVPAVLDKGHQRKQVPRPATVAAEMAPGAEIWQNVNVQQKAALMSTPGATIDTRMTPSRLFWR
jgi:hypothetical protein